MVTRTSAFKWGMLSLSILLCGCQMTRSSDTADRDALTARVGEYSLVPFGSHRPRVAVPPFGVTELDVDPRLSHIAADVMTTLAVRCGRFQMIERTQLEQLLIEQGLEGIVQAGQLARPARIRGVDYLFIGKITNLRVTVAKTSTGFGIAKIVAGQFGMGAFDFKDRRSKVTTECGVDLRLVDPTTGTIPVAHFGEFKRTDTIGAFGIEILGAHAEASADLRVDLDSKGKILRLAIDDAIRKMLPDIDSFLRSQPSN